MYVSVHETSYLSVFLCVVLDRMSYIRSRFATSRMVAVSVRSEYGPSRHFWPLSHFRVRTLKYRF